MPRASQLASLLSVTLALAFLAVVHHRNTVPPPTPMTEATDQPTDRPVRSASNPACAAPPGYVRLVILSDTHGAFPRSLPPGDILIHCGDSEAPADEMDRWAATHPHSHKVAVCGNMDAALRSSSSRLANITYLQDAAVEVAGLKLYGSPWTPRFVGVFQLYSDADARDVWSKVPDGVDVLVTHGPPAGILDRTSRGRQVGDALLRHRVAELRPRVHCFGHVHESYGTKVSNNTMFCNAAVFNGHAPVVVDVPLNKSLPAVRVETAQFSPESCAR